MNEVKMKKCSKCKKDYPLTKEYFYVDRSTKSGFKSRCKICEGNSYAINNRYGLFDVKWKELDCISGIYKITCMGNGKIYIGSAIDFCMRWSAHIDNLRKNKHHSAYMQNSFNKYGMESFKFEIIESVENVNNLITREQYWLDKLKPYDRNIGFNTLRFAGSALGNKLSESTKMKLSEALGKTVLQYSLEGILINRFSSARRASKELNYSHGEICNCANGKKLTYNGYIWIYESGDITLEQKIKEINASRRTILQYDLNGNLIKIWKCTIADIANILGKKYINIPICIMGKQDTLGGFIWRYRYPNEPLIEKLHIIRKGRKLIIDNYTNNKKGGILSE